MEKAIKYLESLPYAHYDQVQQGWIVNGDVDISEMNLEKLPTFIKIKGNFYCCYNKLISFKGCPQEIEGDFYCDHNQITSFKGCPQTIKGNFCCDHNQFASLDGCPQRVKDDFDCSFNPIVSLKGAPLKIKGNFSCVHSQLTSSSLEYLPKKCYNYHIHLHDQQRDKVGLMVKKWYDNSQIYLILEQRINKTKEWHINEYYALNLQTKELDWTDENNVKLIVDK